MDNKNFNINVDENTSLKIIAKSLKFDFLLNSPSMFFCPFIFLVYALITSIKKTLVLSFPSKACEKLGLQFRFLKAIVRLQIKMKKFMKLLIS